MKMINRYCNLSSFNSYLKEFGLFSKCVILDYTDLNSSSVIKRPVLYDGRLFFVPLKYRKAVIRHMGYSYGSVIFHCYYIHEKGVKNENNK